MGTEIDISPIGNGAKVKDGLNSPVTSEVKLEEDREWTVADEKRIRWKLDLRLVPTCLVCYLLCFIDRANIGNAKIQGMVTDLNLVGYRFNWALTIFYLSYVAAEIPSNIILKRLGGKYYLPALVGVFGLISMCTSFVTSYHGILACRFFLGIAEGGALPGMAYYLSTFYRRTELLLRTGIFIQGATLAGSFGGLLAAGLTSIPKWGASSRPLSHWRNIFFFEGIITMLFSVAAAYILPTAPDTAEFLTPKDRYIALERIDRELKETGHEKLEKRHILRAIFNINNIICGLGYFSVNVTVQSFSLFLPTILNALGWTALKTQFYTVPPYLVGVVWSVFIFYLSDRFKCRGVFVILGSTMGAIGYIVLATETSQHVKYGAVFLACAGAFPGGPIFLAWGLNNAAGQTVRAVSGAFIVAIGSCGSILATWTYLDKDKPLYRRGHWINVGANIVAVCLAVTGILYTKWENRQRRKGKRDERLVSLSEEEKADLGYRHPEFRYIS